MRASRTALLSLALIGAVAVAGLVSANSLAPEAKAPPTTELKDLTWVQVRDAIAQGYTTVIVPTGGIEQNGPHMILGKHDYIVGWAAKKIAADVGRTLIAPVVSYVPQLSGHLRYPGTIGVPAPVFSGVLEGIARSLKGSGFKTICFIGDHGDSIDVQTAVVDRLTREWAGSGVRVVHIGGYYEDGPQYKTLEGEGETKAAIGEHAGIIDTSELMAINAKGVDFERTAGRAFPWSANGASGDPKRSTPERGHKLIEMRIQAAVAEIRAALAQR